MKLRSQQQQVHYPTSQVDEMNVATDLFLEEIL
jgi:hypothetical protein